MQYFKSLVFVLTLLTSAGVCLAQQQKPASPWTFHSINTVGILNGESESAPQLQTVNGVGYKSWFAGVGLGLDYYRFRTIPLFMDFRKEFGKHSNRAFVYADLGVSFSWVTSEQKTSYLMGEKFSHGFYNDFGIGYKRIVGKKDGGLLISLGYSYKNITDTYPAYPYYLSYRDPFTTSGYGNEKISYQLNRISLKMGWVF